LLKTIKARYRNGVIEPLEEMDIEDGADITITVSEPDTTGAEGIKKSFGGWKGLIDADQFLKDIYESRKISTRPEVKL
jgi:predicted DNA-binding antitoxin AbrB/MazE fold protein